MDAQFVENIVHEVKSQGVFDEFRKDSMADVDTKPAYQNLRQRVENTVKKFLSEQKWNPDTNKNQLREKLRRHITESGFLDVGVERIVDQVVNPKIGNVFQPRIEEIAYNYLGLPPPPKTYEQPPPPLMHPLPPLPLNAPPLNVETCSLLPTDLEQVSPESDKGMVKFEEQSEDASTSIPVFDMETDDKMLEDEDESPPFEPLIKQEIKAEDVQFEKREEKVKNKEEDKKSLMEDKQNIMDASIKAENILTDIDSQSNFATDAAVIDKYATQSMDAIISQDSQLSSVSSNSRLSTTGKEDSLRSSSQEAVAANISEEAQMPKFNENSSEPNNVNGNGQNKNESKISELHFDIKKDEIKFEGTERKCALNTLEVSTIKTEELKYPETQKKSMEDNKNESFKFSSNNSHLEVKEENVEKTQNHQDSSFGSSIDYSSANYTPKTSIDNKDENSPLLQTPKQQIFSTTPNTTPIPTPSLPTPAATPSPITSHKVEKDQSSRHSSSSSSKHKKHSKERRRSHDREKDKDRYRSSKGTKESSSKYYSHNNASKSSKHSSSYSSKSSSSHNKATEKDFEKSSSSSTHSSSKHSKHYRSSSCNDHKDAKNRTRDSDRRHHSSSGTHKEHSSSSSKRSERKDDHSEAKHKIQRRKTTDSNDDDGDKILGGGRSSSQYKSCNMSTSASKSSNTKSTNDNSKSSNTKAKDPQKDHTQLQLLSNEELPTKPEFHNNVVILNDLLENPQIQCVQLDNTGHLIETPMHAESFNSSIKNKESLEFNNNNECSKTKEDKNVDLNTSLDLLYFQDRLADYNERLELFDKTIDLCRSAVNSLRFVSTSDEDILLTKIEDNETNNNSSLLTETLKRKSKMNFEDYEKTPCKRSASIESEECPSKTSPTPSDSSSVNSKENQEIDKNTDLAKKTSVDGHKVVQKFTRQQSYSSEDLYKPRPILGQRSRRRGMDSLV